MSTVEAYMNLLLPYVAGSWVLVIALSIWKPQRFKNAFALMWALFITIITLCALFGDNMVEAVAAVIIVCAITVLLVPVLLITNGIITVKREGKSLANMLSLILGILIGAGEIAYFNTIFNGVFYSVNSRIDAALFVFGNTVLYFSIIILTFVIYSIYIQYIPKTIDFNYVIIHGCGLLGGSRVSPLLAGRIDKAIEIYNGCTNKPILIPSGGRGSDENLSEAEAMKAYLLERGIPEENIYCEDRSTTTMENLANCKQYIDERGGVKKYRIALVSSNYHVYRCLLYAEKLKMRCIGIGAKVAWYYWPSALLREFVAIFRRPSYIIWAALGYIFLIVIPSLQILGK